MSDPAAIGFVFMEFREWKRSGRKYETVSNSWKSCQRRRVEYIRGVPVVKTFGQTVFSFKRFKEAIDEYEKWTLGFTKK